MVNLPCCRADLDKAIVVNVTPFGSELVHLGQMSKLQALTKDFKLVQCLPRVCLDALNAHECLVFLGLARCKFNTSSGLRPFDM